MAIVGARRRTLVEDEPVAVRAVRAVHHQPPDRSHGPRVIGGDEHAVRPLARGRIPPVEVGRAELLAQGRDGQTGALSKRRPAVDDGAGEIPIEGESVRKMDAQPAMPTCAVEAAGQASRDAAGRDAGATAYGCTAEAAGRDAGPPGAVRPGDDVHGATAGVGTSER